MDTRTQIATQVQTGTEPATSTERRAPARLLEYKRGQYIALAAHATLELVERPALLTVPGSPYFCRGLMAWQGKQLPLIDFNTLVRAYPDETAAPLAHVLVVAYQSRPGQPLEYGALCAPALLTMVEVTDSQQCELPNDSDLWPLLAMACFSHEGAAVPIIDTSRLFSQSYS